MSFLFFILGVEKQNIEEKLIFYCHVVPVPTMITGIDDVPVAQGFSLCIFV
jgi:hypothetical protein